MSTQVTDEFLDAVIKRDSVETGYITFALDGVDSLQTTLNENLIERLQEKLTKVENFNFSWLTHDSSTLAD